MNKISRKARKLRRQSWSNKNERARKIFDIVNILLFIAIIIVLILILFACHRQEGDVQPSETDTATAETDSEMSSLEETEEESSAEESETEATSELVPETETVEESTTEKASSSESSVTTAKPPTSQTQKPIKVTVTIKNIISVYGDEFKALDYEITSTSGNVTKSELSKYITLTKQDGKTVGQYWITGTCIAPSLFDVKFIPGIYTINLREVTLQAENKESYVGEKLKDLTYTVLKGSIVNGDEVVKLYIEGDPTKVGTYDIKDKWKNPNYTLTVKVGKYTVKEKSSSSGSEETKPIDVTVKILDKSSYYGDTIVAPDFSITKGNVEKSVLAKYITLKKDNGNNVGSYKITAKCKDTGGKYKITVENVGTYTIKARKLSIKVDNKESFVGETLATPTYSVISGSVVAGDDVIEFSTNADSSKAGTYYITAKSKNSNYNVNISNKGVYTVKKKDVTVKIENATVTYGESVDPDFSVLSADVTKDEIDPYITLSKEGGNNVGSYRIIATCSDNNKYNVTFIEGTYTITQRIIVVKADDKMTYEGEALADLTYTLTSGSIIAGDNVISLSTTATPTALGEYPITVSCLNSNYVLHSENGTYRVKAKPQPPKDEEEEVGESSSSGPSDEEDDVEPNKPTPSAPKESETGLTDEEEEVLPTTSTP